VGTRRKADRLMDGGHRGGGAPASIPDQLQRHSAQSVYNIIWRRVVARRRPRLWYNNIIVKRE